MTQCHCDMTVYLNMYFLLLYGLPLSQFVNVLQTELALESLTKRIMNAAKKLNSLVYSASFTTARCLTKKWLSNISRQEGLLEISLGSGRINQKYSLFTGFLAKGMTRFGK